MDILVSLIAEIAKYTVVPIGRQAGYLLFYKSNFKKLADHFKELEGARVKINHCIEEERRNSKEIETNVVNWLEKVDELFKRVNQLQDDPRAGCSRISFPNLVLRHQLSRKAFKITKDVIQLHENGNFDKIGYELAPDEVAFSCNPTRGGEKLETRESFKENILKALKDPNVRNVGVYGLGGVGKTTLVEEVARIAKQEKLFNVVVMAHVSKAPIIETIQKKIAEMLGLDFGDATDAGTTNRLRHRIKAEKTILVILDDIWTRLDLEKVGIPSGGELSGCKLLMTSRNKDVLLQMGIRKISTFRLELLNEEEAWCLFQAKIGDVNKDIAIQSVAIKVAKKCGGLPLGIVALAGTLRDREIDVWEDALRQLERFDHEEHDAKIYSVLELSYNSLKSSEMKEFFLLFAVLTGSMEYYLIVGIGLGIFRDLHTVRDARTRLRRIITSLKESCLLHEDNASENIEMHDSVREVALSIACRDKQVFMTKPMDELKWPKNDLMRSFLQIHLNDCHIDVLPEWLDCPHIKLFYLYNADRSLVIPDTFFQGKGSLEVLDLTCLNLSMLPTSFRSLTNLKALCLDQCVLNNMDAIEALISLEILRFWKSSMNMLPSEIGKLTQLRILDLSDSGIEVIPSNIISNLTKLEELKMGNTSIKWEYQSSSNQNDKASLVELQQLSNLTNLELQIREAWILPRELKLMFDKLTRYKIVIGDVWEWSAIEDVSLKTLMLKLGTNIHLEHGIKALIKGVENLYLDEVDGIQNVLYQLSWEGFPLLKHLYIQNNAKIKHIVDSIERNQVHVSFLNLETLVLQNLKNLEQICHGPLVVNSFRKLSVIKVKNCIQLKYLLSFSMVKGLSQLSEIEVCQCSSMKEIVHEVNDSSANDMTNEKVEFVSLHSLTLEHLETLGNFYSYGGRHQRVENSVSAPLFSFQIAFPNLDTLKLSSLELTKIWDGNQYSLEKLSNLIVENCSGLKYLFPSTIIQSFKSLKWLEISNCHSMEEIIATEEINNGTSTALEEVRFFKLEKVILKDMKNLNRIWYTQFKKLKMLQVNNCEKIVVVFSSSMQKSYNNLEMLEVTNCALVEEIFELTSHDHSGIEDTTHMKGITLDGLPKLQKIWSQDPIGILGFGNLENVNLESCDGLEYLFPFYVASCCSNLKELRIKYCRNMKEIIAENKEDIGISPMFDFNQLNTLLVWFSDKLKGFYAGNYTLECASLRKIDVTYCPKLTLYKTLSPSSPKRLLDGRLSVLMQQAPFILEQVIPNLEWLRLNIGDADMILQAQYLGALFTKLTFLGLSNYKNEDASFPYWFLHNVHTLEHLVVEWSSFRKIFDDERPISEKIHTRLKKLTLHQLPHLQHICEEGFRIDPILEVLEHLHVHYCHSLTNLLPSSVTFSHLTKLKIEKCNGLVNLFTCSTAQSLVKLTTMTVKKCDSIEEIITDEQNVFDIAFINLEILKLKSLPRLKKFCSPNCILKFPLLEEVVLRECPRMELFCEGDTKTPILRKVKISNNDEETHWKENLNDTVKNMFEDKVSFYSFEHLKLFEYPELKESWYNQLQCNVFRSLKYLVVHKCDFLSDVLFQSNLLELLINLEELDVKDCESLEAVFDLKGEFAAGQNPVKNSSQLKKLKLFNLPKLRHVWKEDPHNTLRFQNLCEVSVEKCKSLISLIPLSIARDIVKLQNLHVSKCGVLEEIVANEEGIEEIINFMFPNLVSLNLVYLLRLKALFAGKHSIQCKSLKSIEVFRCPKFQLFETKAVRHQQRAGNDKLNFTMYRPLFVIEELHSGVKNLILNSKDFGMILQCQHSRVQLKDLKQLNMDGSYNEEATFPYSFLENVPNLESLVLNSCSFTEIFESENFICLKKETQIRPRLKELKLWNLDQLQHVCKEGLQIDPILQLLESIYIYNCSGLVKLVPSSITFTCLTDLEVSHCHGLINLITLSTTKSLVKLKRMKIEACNLLEDVINANEGETNHKVTFCNLESLELISLPRLRQFCSCMCPIEFMLLEEVVVRDCPRMETFSLGETSTPNLQGVQIEENDYEHRWSGDLNATIKDMFDDKIAFCKFQCLSLSDYPELKDLWYGQLNHHNLFCNLKSLTVQRCDFLSHVLLPYNVMQVLHGLQDLEVRDCDSLKAVFDVKGMKPQEISIKQSTQLKGLTLSDLPNLKHIWNEDPCEIMSFENLCTMDVSICENLLNIFPPSLCQDLGHLEKLRIVSCGVGEIVGMVEQSMESIIFSFPRLTHLQLAYLTKLKSFYPGKHTLECSSLKTLSVYRCEALRMFSFNYLDFPQPKPLNDDTHDIPSGQALFSLEMLISNLEELAINATDAMRVVKGPRQENVYRNIKFLRLQCFTETPSNFVNDFHEIFPSLETLQVRNSSFETLFRTKGTTSHLSLQVSKPIKKLWLYELENLKNIWQEDFPLSHPLLKDLEELKVSDCQSLISLAPSRSSFTNLTSLEVNNCKELVYLITSSTAESLVQLTKLVIRNCEKMLDVVKIDEENAGKYIIFEKLEDLEFTSLSSLRSFCYGKHTLIFPSLLWFYVKGCPQMSNFSLGVTIAPYLKSIEVEEEKDRWKGDLNLTIQQLFREQEVKKEI